MTPDLLISRCPVFLNRSVFKFGLRVSELFLLAFAFLVLETIFKTSAHKFYFAEMPVILTAGAFMSLNRVKEEHYVEKFIRYVCARRHLQASRLEGCPQ